MDWNLNTSTEWDWENIAMYGTKEMEVPKNLQFSNNQETGSSNVVVDNNNVDFSFSAASADSSSKETIKNFGAFDDLPKEFLLEKEESSSWAEENNGSFCSNNIVVEEANSVLSGEAMVGLKLGRHSSAGGASNCRDNKTSSATTTSVPLFPTSSSPMIKRSRASYLSSQSPRCQVEGCNLDLSSAKDYHRRHRICANHSKSPKVVVAGMERRFCQQCSRFHDLSEFDDRKRSCRRRLSAHNARRRRPQSEELQFGSTRMSSSSICDRRPPMNFLLNRASIPILDSTPPESSCNFKGEDQCLRGLSKGVGVDALPTTAGSLNFGSDQMFISRNVNHNGMDATSNSILGGDHVRHAFSLLSTSSWPSSWPPEEPSASSTFDHQFAHGNSSSISLAQPGMPLELQNTSNNNNTQLQDFHSFRSPHDQFERFYSN